MYTFVEVVFVLLACLTTTSSLVQLVAHTTEPATTARALLLILSGDLAFGLLGLVVAARELVGEAFERIHFDDGYETGLGLGRSSAFVGQVQ